MGTTFKGRVYDLVEAKKGGRPGRIFDFCIMVLIFLNVVAVVLDTHGDLSARYESWFWAFECFSVAVFSVEYLLRLYSCTEDARYARPFLGRVRCNRPSA